MEQNPGRKGGLKKFVLVVLILGVLGIGGYYGFVSGYLQPLLDSLSLGAAELKNARGVIRDLRRMDLSSSKHLNIFLLESDSGELIPLSLDYDNHGLKDGDRIDVTYDSRRLYHALSDPSVSNSTTTFIARLSVVCDFRLVKEGAVGMPKVEKE